MSKKTGIAIALAWPETLCKQPGSWYDKPLLLLGINKNHYYKVGHAAVVLVSYADNSCHYFDFGRYHAPFQHGRVRSAVTDHDLRIFTKANISNGKLLNFTDILFELFQNESCHGNGSLHASYCEVNFENSMNTANKLQAMSPIRYGPFLPKGTNCSRFVNSVILSGKPKLVHRILLFSPKTLSPTPMSNVSSLNHYQIISKESIKPKSQYSII